MNKKQVAEYEALKEFEEEMAEEQAEQSAEDSQDLNMEFMEGYGVPEPEEKINQHAFLNKAAFVTPDTTRVSYLDKDELGRPIFNVRFLLDMEDISDFYLSELCEELGEKNEEGKVIKPLPNKIAQYFRDKISNITDSGMSNEGFSMRLNTTRNIDISRTKRKERIENLQGRGNQQRGAGR